MQTLLRAPNCADQEVMTEVMQEKVTCEVRKTVLVDGWDPPEGTGLAGGSLPRGTFEALARRPFSVITVSTLRQCERHLRHPRDLLIR